MCNCNVIEFDFLFEYLLLYLEYILSNNPRDLSARYLSYLVVARNGNFRRPRDIDSHAPIRPRGRERTSPRSLSRPLPSSTENRVESAKILQMPRVRWSAAIPPRMISKIVAPESNLTADVGPIPPFFVLLTFTSLSYHVASGKEEIST